MIDRHSDQAAKPTPTLVLVALAAECTSGTNCALFGLQCGAPTAEQESKAAAAEATLKQEGALLGPTGHYGTPYGPDPQYGSAGGGQYGYGLGYSYARQAPELPNDTPVQQKK